MSRSSRRRKPGIQVVDDLVHWAKDIMPLLVQAKGRAKLRHNNKAEITYSGLISVGNVVIRSAEDAVKRAKEESVEVIGLS
jgi:hypothetical protein